MKIPFTIEQFLSAFENYNLSIWPMQIILNILAVFVVIMLFYRKEWSNNLINFILGFFWIWTGLVYHILNFSSINKPALIFGFLFIIEGFLILYFGMIRKKLKFVFHADIYGFIGLIFILYSLIIYPILGYNLGHVYPQSPTFGAPCPMTIFTFGIFLFNQKRFPKYILIIPLIWALIGFSAAVNLHIQEDFGLVVAGILGTILIILKDSTKKI